MNKKGTQTKNRLASRKTTDYSFDQIFNNSMYELFHPRSNSKLIDYSQLVNLVDWKQLKLIDHRQLNLVNLSVLSLFLQYVGAVVFVFMMVFALPIRIYLDSALTIKHETESYLYTQTLIDQQINRNLANQVLDAKNLNKNIAVRDNDASQSDWMQSDPVHKEFTLTSVADFSFDADLASLSSQQSAIPGDVLGATQVLNQTGGVANYVGSEPKSYQSEHVAVLIIDQNSVFSDQADQANGSDLYTAEPLISFEITDRDIFDDQTGSLASAVDTSQIIQEIALINDTSDFTAKLSSNEGENQPSVAGVQTVISKQSTIEVTEVFNNTLMIGEENVFVVDDNVLGVQDTQLIQEVQDEQTSTSDEQIVQAKEQNQDYEQKSEQFKRASVCSFKNLNNFYSNGAVIKAKDLTGKVCFNVDKSQAGTFEVGFTNLNGNRIYLSVDVTGCLDADKIKGLSGELTVDYKDTIDANCSLILASL